MNLSRVSSFAFFAVVLIVATFAAMQSLPAQEVKLIDDRKITIKSNEGIIKRRQELIKFIWGSPEMPAGTLPTVEKNDKSPVSGLNNLERVDTLTITMEASEKSYAHHFIPKRKNNRLVILHHGHATSFNDNPTPEDVGHGMQRTINGLLTDGYSVLAVYMPHTAKFNTRLSVNDSVDDKGRPISHADMFNKIKVKNGSVMKFFLEPVTICLNYLKTRAAADGFPIYQDFSMVGLSGGGWTTVVYAAIDPTIKLSFPVAGSMPLYLWPRHSKGYSIGDGAEQTLSGFYQIAGYPDLYVLGSHGPGRKQVHILNRHDDCCFGEGQHQNRARQLGMTYDGAVRDYEHRIRLTLYNLGSKGFFRVEIDEATPSQKPFHRISPNALVNTILAEMNGGRKYIGAVAPTDAFVRGMNGHLWHHSPDGWKDTGFPMVGVPTVVKGSVNDLDVFYRNPRNEPMHAYYANGIGWKQKPIEGIIITDPAAISTEKGKIDVVAFGRNYRLYHWRLTDKGVNPYTLVEGSKPGLGNPALVSRGPKQLDVFYRGFDGGLYHVHSIGDPTPWKSESLGGTMLDSPTAVVALDGSLRVYLRGQSSRLFEAAQTKKDAPWQWNTISDQTGGQLIAGSPSASVDGSVVRVQARTSGDGLGTFTLVKEWSFANHGGSIIGSPTAIPGGAFARSGSGGLLLNDRAKWFNRDGIFD